MIQRLWIWLRDFWRGYSVADMVSLLHKLNRSRAPWEVITLTPAEHAVLIDWRILDMPVRQFVQDAPPINEVR